jgi:hypothetical protein
MTRAARAALGAWRIAVLALLVFIAAYMHHHDKEAAAYDSQIWAACAGLGARR